MKKGLFWALGLLLLSLSGTAAAQSGVCSSHTRLAFARTGSACYGLERDQACYGNGEVGAILQDDAFIAPFVQAGDRIWLEYARTIVVVPLETEVSVATLTAQMSLSDTEARGVAMLLFGSGTLQNHVDYLPEIPVTATGTLNIRRTPESDGEIITQLAVNKGVVANGRTADGRWLRVYLPDMEQLGWVAREVVSAQDNLDALTVVDAESIVYNPFQVMTLRTDDAGLCDGTLPGGLLIQPPNVEDAVQLYINSVEVRLAGTAYMDTLDGLRITVLDGEADVLAGGESRYVPAGSLTRVPIEVEFGQGNGAPSPAEPYEMASLANLPINNLPARFTIAEPLTMEQIDTLLAERRAAQAAAAAAVTPVPVQPCRRFTAGTATLWAGPGEFYEAINEIPAGRSVFPVLQISDADGVVWWQLNNSNWIRAGDVRQSGECGEIPLTDFVPRQDYNTLSLETCETQNGPLRAGQVVTIQFTPPAFENYYDASIARRVDPGQITINERYQYVTASDPISLGKTVTPEGEEMERYLRVFSTTWTATGGPHRIVGERLSYILTCSITVPFG